MRIATGEAARDDTGVSKRFGGAGVWPGTSNDDLRDAGGESCQATISTTRYL